MTLFDSEFQFHDVGGTDDFAEGKGTLVEVADTLVGLFRIDGEFFAMEDACPHMGASLTAGYLDQCVVACPWHGWRFDVRDGTWVDNPRIKTGSYPVRVINSRVNVGMPIKKAKEGDDTMTSDASAESLEKAQVTIQVESISGAESEMSKAKELEKNAPQSASDNPLGLALDVGSPRRSELTLTDFQALIHKMYYEKDVARGVEGTFMWLMEEVGELSSALRERDRENQLEEFADVLAWLCTIANVCGIDLTEAVRIKYGEGCPGCKKLVCTCPDSEKP